MVMVFRPSQRPQTKKVYYDPEVHLSQRVHFIMQVIQRDLVSSREARRSPMNFCLDYPLPATTPGFYLNPPRRRRLLSLRQSIYISSKKALSDEKTSESENLLLKIAWYSSELLGIAASVFRSPQNAGVESSATSTISSSEGTLVLDRERVVSSIKDDFSRSYFVTGNLTVDAYLDDCEFADPAGSFKGLQRFKRNCTNFGSLIEKSNMKLTKWEDLEDKGVGHWRFSCVMSFPWKPILSATGFTEYYFDAETGKVCRHVENWNVPKMALLKQLLKPSKPFLFWR